MASKQKQQRKILEPHIPSGESVKASATGRGKITAVTDRRVLSVTAVGTETKKQQEVESVLLTADQVVGTRYGKTDQENRATLQRILGIILAVLGGFLILGGIVADGDGRALLFLVGLALLGLGIYLFQTAEDTMEGSVSITVRRAGDVPDRTWTFPRGHTEVPQAVSEQVARIHGPK